MKEGDGPTLIYDAECSLCVSSKEWMERWDRRRRIRFLPFRSEEAKRLLPEIASLDYLDSMRLVDKKGASAGVDAFRGMLPYLPMGWVLSLFFFTPGFSRLAVWVYHWIAKNRYRWFGKVLINTEGNRRR